MSKCLLVTVLLAAAAWQPVAAQVRRCTTSEGMDIYTDRACPDVGAVERPPEPVAPRAGAKERGGGCARNLRELVQEINGAFDARDANRLAGVYNWAGMSGSAAYAALERLDALVQQPLIGIYPVMPVERSEEAPPESLAVADGSEPPPRPRQAPVALRVEQTLANGSTPSRTVFGLQKYFGCWWIKG